MRGLLFETRNGHLAVKPPMSKFFNSDLPQYINSQSQDLKIENVCRLFPYTLEPVPPHEGVRAVKNSIVALENRPESAQATRRVSPTRVQENASKPLSALHQPILSVW
jgi:hypothetical protein